MSDLISFQQKICFRLCPIWLTFLLVACGGGGGSGGSDGKDKPPVTNVGSTSVSSANVSAASSVSRFAAPENLAVIPGDAKVVVTWNEVSGATGYRIYIASDPNIIPVSIASFEGGMRIDNATSPHTINNLRNAETYYLVVTALQDNEESPPSLEVSATPSSVDLARQPTPQEVLVMELVNRARANPGAEAARLGIGLNDGLSGAPITDTPKQPLAHNLELILSSRLHSQWMLDQNIFSHTGAKNSTPHQRMEAAGYKFTGNWTSGENIAWGGTTGNSISLTAYAASQHDGLFKSPGHRVNILNGDFRELGVGQLQGYFTQEGDEYLSSMLTQNFARSGTTHFLTGVIYEDKNKNAFYDVGEGLSGISITTNSKTYQAFASGAYSIPLSNGTYQLSITGDALDAPVYYSVQISGKNQKLDVIKTNSGNRVSVP